MAGESKNVSIGGLTVDVELNDATIDARLDALAAKLASVAKTYTASVKLVDDMASGAMKKRGNQAIEVKSELKFSVTRERQAMVERFKDKPIEVPVKFHQASVNRAVADLKRQILEAFKNFEVPINFKLGNQVGGPGLANIHGVVSSASMGGDEDADAGGRLRETKRVAHMRPTVPYSNDRAMEKVGAALKDAAKALQDIKAHPDARQGDVNKVQAQVNRYQRLANLVEGGTPAEVMRKQNPAFYNAVTEAVEVVSTRQRKPMRRRGFKPGFIPPTPTAVPVAEAPEPTIAPAPQHAETREETRERLGLGEAPVLKRPRKKRPPQAPTLTGRDAELAEAAQRREKQLSGIEAGMSRSLPEVGPERRFDREPFRSVEPRSTAIRGTAVGWEGIQAGGGLVVRGPITRAGPQERISRRGNRRRIGPLRSFARDPENMGPNQIEGSGARGKRGEPSPRNVFDTSGRYSDDPKIQAIQLAFERGEYGTRERPSYEELDVEGKHVLDDEGNPKVFTGDEALFDYVKRERINVNRAQAFNYRGKQLRFVAPSTLAKRDIKKLGELGPVEKDRLFGVDTANAGERERRRKGFFSTAVPREPQPYEPGIHRGVGRGGLPMARRSEHDTPEGNRASQARIEEARFQTAYKGLDTETRATVDALKTKESKRAFLRPFLPEYSAGGIGVDEERQLRAAAPREFELPEIDAIFAQYLARDTDLTGLPDAFLPRNRGGELIAAPTPEQAYRARLNAFQREYNVSMGKLNITPKTHPAARGPAFNATQRKQIDVQKGQMRNARGDRKGRYRPGPRVGIEERREDAITRVASREKTSTTRPRQRTLTEGESQYEDARLQLERLEGSRASTPFLGVSQAIDTGAIPAVESGQVGTAQTLAEAEERTGIHYARRRPKTAAGSKRATERMGEIELSKLLLREVQARAENKRRESAGEPLVGEERQGDRFSGFVLQQDIERAKITKASVFPGLDTEPMANVKAARNRVRRAQAKARRLRNYLPQIAQARATERTALEERGINTTGGPVIPGEPTVLSGTDFSNKVAEAADLPLRVMPQPGAAPAAAGAKPTDFAARAAKAQKESATTCPIDGRKFVDAASLAAHQKATHAPKSTASAGSSATLMAAEERSAALTGEPPTGGKPPSGKASLGGGGGGVVDVRVMNWPKGLGGTGTGVAGAAEEVSPRLGPKRRAPAMEEALEGPRGARARGVGFTILETPAERRTREREAARIKADQAREERKTQSETRRAEREAKAAEGRAGRLGGDLPPRSAKTNPSRARIMAGLSEFGLEEVKPKPVERNGKTQADIEAEGQILEARSLNPTRAFQTAVAAGFAKTIGGGGAFEERVKGLTDTIRQRRGAVRSLEQTAPEQRALAENIRNVNAAIDKAVKSGGKVPTGLEASRKQFVREFEELREQRAGRIEQVGRLSTRVEEQRKGLITPVGVARGFAALGVGAIAGGIIFSAAQQLIQGAIEVFATQAQKGADALSGFAMTTNKVAGQLAGGYAQSQAAGRAGVAEQAFNARMGLAGFRQIEAGIGPRASALAARDAIQQRTELTVAAQRAAIERQQYGGYDKALFTTTGGINVRGQGMGGALSNLLGLSEVNIGGEKGLPETLQEYFRGTFEDVGKRQAAAGVPGVPSTGPTMFGYQARGMAPANLSADVVKALQVDSEQLKAFNETLKGSKFKVVEETDTKKLAEIQRQVYEAGGPAELFRALQDKGLRVEGLDPTNFKQIGEFLKTVAGQSRDPQVMLQAMRPALERAGRQIQREQSRELDVSLPVQAALENLANPVPTAGGKQRFGLGVKATSASEQKLITQETQKTADVQNTLNAYYAKGEALLTKEYDVPVALLNQVKSLSKEIASIQGAITQRNAALQAAEYSNQLRIARRTLGDIAGLSGKSTGVEATRLGILQRQNIELSRQSEKLQFQLQQRQINFQVALAGFTAPGVTPEERQARIDEAKQEAAYAQKQLDIQKQMFGTNIKIFNEENLRAATDAIASIRLLQQGRDTSVRNALDEERLAKKQKQQQELIKQVNTYVARVDKLWQTASAALTALEEAYGSAITNITIDTIKGFITFEQQLQQYISQSSPSAPPGHDANTRPQYATGVLFDTAGPTSMIVGEAGKETVAVLRHPRMVSMPGGGGMGGGGNNVQIQINVTGTGGDNDELANKIARKVEDTLNRKTALLGLRRPA